MEKEFWSLRLSEINSHIMRDCAPGEYDWNRKGLIVADDESGEVLDFVKKNLKYDELKKAGKVNEINVDETCASWFIESEAHKDNCYKEFWNNLVVAAYKANHGLLVINISNMDAFKHCWHLKKLAKQEDKLVVWSAISGTEFTPNQLKELAEGFIFDGYVLIVINGMNWDEVSDFANDNNLGEFNAMMDFYTCVH